MTKDEALKLALEALEVVTREMLAIRDELAERGARPTTNVFHQRLWDSSFKAYTDHALPASIAIREALAQPEQINTIRALTEQCATLVWERNDLKKQVQTYEKHGVTCQTYRHKVKASCSECNVNEIYTAQPEQEPVAWLYIEPNNPHLNVHYDDVDVSQFPHDEWFPVYRSSLQRTWQGLTDEEMHECWDSPLTPLGMKHARMIEAKLKEKNT